jgi:hypothetical protein
MGPWNSDGIFGYESVSMAAVERAVEVLDNANLLVALQRLRRPEGTKTFVKLLEDFGSALVVRIVIAYREFSLWPEQAVLVNSKNPVQAS